MRARIGKLMALSLASANGFFEVKQSSPVCEKPRKARTSNISRACAPFGAHRRRFGGENRILSIAGAIARAGALADYIGGNVTATARNESPIGVVRLLA